jgi:hypothetical protein
MDRNTASLKMKSSEVWKGVSWDDLIYSTCRATLPRAWPLTAAEFQEFQGLCGVYLARL